MWDEFTGAAAATQATQPAGSVPNAPASSTAPPSTFPDTRSTTTNPRPPPSPPHSTPTEPASTKNRPSSPSRAPLVVSSSSAAALADHSTADTSPSSSTLPSPAPPPPPGTPSNTPSPAPPSVSNPHQVLNTGTLIAIVLSALAVALALVLILLFFSRRRRSESNRTSGNGDGKWKWNPRMSESESGESESARRRLEPHVYSGRSSRRVSSVWTGFGSVSVDPAFDAETESRRELLRARSSFGSLPVAVAVAEKPPEGGALVEREGGATHTPGASLSPSLAEVEVEPDPLARNASVRRDRTHHNGPLLPHLDVRVTNARFESSEDLLQLQVPLRIGCDYTVANPLEHHSIGTERSVLGVGLTTRSLGETQGVEAS